TRAPTSWAWAHGWSRCTCPTPPRGSRSGTPTSSRAPPPEPLPASGHCPTCSPCVPWRTPPRESSRFSLTSRAAVPLNWPTIQSPSAGAVVRRGGTRHTKEKLVATTNDLKNGIVLKMNNELWKELEFKHDKPDNGAAFMRTQIKNITS